MSCAFPAQRHHLLSSLDLLSVFVLGFHASRAHHALFVMPISYEPFEHLPLLYPFAVIISFVYTGVFWLPSYANIHLYAKMTICGLHLLILSHQMWWCIMKRLRTCSFQPISTLTDSKLEMSEAANSFLPKTPWDASCLYSLQATAATVAQRTVSKRHFMHLPVARRTSTTKLLSLSFPSPSPVSAWESLLTHLAASLLQYTTSASSLLFSKGIALSLAGFLGSRPKLPQSLWTCFPIPYV